MPSRIKIPYSPRRSHQVVAGHEQHGFRIPRENPGADRALAVAVVSRLHGGGSRPRRACGYSQQSSGSASARFTSTRSMMIESVSVLYSSVRCRVDNDYFRRIVCRTIILVVVNADHRPVQLDFRRGRFGGFFRHFCGRLRREHDGRFRRHRVGSGVAAAAIFAASSLCRISSIIGLAQNWNAQISAAASSSGVSAGKQRASRAVPCGKVSKRRDHYPQTADNADQSNDEHSPVHVLLHIGNGRAFVFVRHGFNGSDNRRCRRRRLRRRRGLRGRRWRRRWGNYPLSVAVSIFSSKSPTVVSSPTAEYVSVNAAEGANTLWKRRMSAFIGKRCWQRQAKSRRQT